MTDAKPSKLDRLLSKQRQLAQEIAAINAREKAGERKNDTRRKILIGGAVLASHQHGDFTEKQLVALLDGFLVYPRDRALFPFLPSRPDDAANVDASAPSSPDLTAPVSDAGTSPPEPSLALDIVTEPPKPALDKTPPMDRRVSQGPIARKEGLI